MKQFKPSVAVFSLILIQISVLFRQPEFLYPQEAVRYLILAVGLSLLSLGCCINQYSFKRGLSSLDFGVFIFITFLLFYNSIHPHYSYNQLYFGIILLFYISLALLFERNVCLTFTCYSGLLILVILLAIGYKQLLYLRESESITEIITGTFTNSSPYGIYLGCLTAFTGCLYKNRLHPLAGCVLSYLLLLFTLILLVYIRNRTGILIASVVLVVRIIQENGMIQRFWRNHNRKCLAASGIILIIITVFFYFWKPDSVNGRLFLWLLSLKTILSNPFIGFGPQSFTAAHNKIQAIFFEDRGFDNKWVHQAAEVKFAYNEWLHFGVELGFIGITILLLILYFTFRAIKNRNINLLNSYYDSAVLFLTGCIIASIFSYPFHKISFLVIILPILYAIGGNNKYVLKFKKPNWLPYAMIVIIIIITFMQMRNYIYHDKWSEAHQLYKEDKSGALLKYKQLETYFNDNPKFLFNYGAKLSQTGYYDKAIKKLNKASKFLYTPKVLQYLGYSYEETGELKKAICYYNEASHIAPYLFYPKYRLMQAYQKSDSISKAKKVAREIVNLSPKVNNDKVEHMKKKAREYLK